MTPRQDQADIAETLQELLRKARNLARVARRRDLPPPVAASIKGTISHLERGLSELSEATGAVPSAASRFALVPDQTGARLVERLVRAEEVVEAASQGEAPVPSTPADLEGHTGAVAVAELFEMLTQLSKTGVIVFEFGRETVSVELDHGRVAHAASNGSQQGERLGDLLVSRGALTAEELGEAILTARREGQLLGAHLLASGRVSPRQLREALAAQVQRLFNRLFAVQDARYRFYERHVGGDDRHLDLNLRRLLFESARIADEAEAPSFLDDEDDEVPAAGPQESESGEGASQSSIREAS